MIENNSQYIEALDELKNIKDTSRSFNENMLIQKGYPIWIIKNHREYLLSRPAELQKLIDEYKQSNSQTIIKPIIKPIIKQPINVQGAQTPPAKRFRKRRKFKSRTK